MVWAKTPVLRFLRPDPMGRRWRHILWSCAALAVLSACDFAGPPPPDTKPQARPARVAPVPEPPKPSEPSPEALELQRYYARVQESLLTRGLLRVDGGGVDTPFTDEMLARNFERVALAEEYARGAGLRPSNGALGAIKKWTTPVRVGVTFGSSVSEDIQTKDRQTLRNYTNRLARVSGHPVSFVAAQPNFHVLVMGADDKDELRAALDRIAPGMENSSRSVFLNLPRSIHCLVVAFSEGPTGYAYRRAVALVRSEHPDLTRRACYHEELAQGMGLANDDQNARPSIFNDDEEFALLTTHDEMLLRILYNPRLTPGMTATEARPIVQELARNLVGGPS